MDHKWIELFDGRRDAVGTDAGGCLRIDPQDWERMMEQHFIDTPIGVYPMVNNQVRWGCVDFDHSKPGSLYSSPEEAREASLLIHRVLARLNIVSWMELSRSRGQHLWVFCTEFVPASTMRNALVAAHEIVDMQHREINPKSASLRADQLGNYVRLPYAARSQTQRVESLGEWLSVEEFTSAAWDTRNTPDVVANAARLVKRVAPRPQIRPVPLGNHNARLGRVARKILRDGPREDDDRSLTLCRLAGICAGDGLSAQETLSVLYEADARWGKFQQQNRPEQLDRIVAEVYSK